MKRLYKIILLLVSFSASTAEFQAYSQQIPDTAFKFTLIESRYEPGQGPLIYIDRAHNNMHTLETGFFAFGKLLESDGYRVESLTFTVNDPVVLNGCEILVIANALDSSNLTRWILPTPSAFSNNEISVIKNWVAQGGRLFLIADHMPFAGAAKNLALAFGFEFLNGFAITGERSWPPSVFTLADTTLGNSPVVEGVLRFEKIDTVATFTGSAFRSPATAIPLLVFRQEDYSLQPDTAWRFNAETPSQHLEGYSQGAIMRYGNGGVAVFGEAAMFTAQIVNGNVKVGFNSEYAAQNAQFTLNLVHWLDGNMDY